MSRKGQVQILSSRLCLPRIWPPGVSRLNTRLTGRLARPPGHEPRHMNCSGDNIHPCHQQWAGQYTHLVDEGEVVAAGRGLPHRGHHGEAARGGVLAVARGRVHAAHQVPEDGGLHPRVTRVRGTRVYRAPAHSLGPAAHSWECRKYLLYSRKIFAPGDVLVDGQGPHQHVLLLARAGPEAEPDGHWLGHLDVELVEGGAAVVTIY